MFNTITMRGRGGSLVWGAGAAALCVSWAVARDDRQQWTLSATVARVDSFRVRQVPLIFQAPRTSKPRGLWCWPVVPNSIVIAGHTLTAKLGPMEGQ